MEIDVRKLYICYKGQTGMMLCPLIGEECDEKENCNLRPVVNYSDYEELYKQLQQLKAENEELKNKLDIMTSYFEKADGESFKYKQCLEEIEELCKINPIDTCWTALNLCDKCKEKEECGLQSPFARLNAIKNTIKQAKEN